MRKQVGLKFEEESLVRWDAWAAEHKLSRTEMFELAVERLVGDRPVENVPESQPEPRHEVSQKVRRIFVCQKCRSRTSVEREKPAGYIPECPEHGPMVRQMNVPYLGKSTEPPAEWGWPEAKDDPRVVLGLTKAS